MKGAGPEPFGSISVREERPERAAWGTTATIGADEWPGSEGQKYFNARWYDPGTGRFISEDPVLDGTLWYVYCYNNPLRYVDPTGLEADELEGGGSVETGAAKSASILYLEECLDVELPDGTRYMADIGDAIPSNAILTVPSNQTLELTIDGTSVTMSAGEETARIDMAKLAEAVAAEREKAAREKENKKLLLQGAQGFGEMLAGVVWNIGVSAGVVAAFAATEASGGVASPVAVAAGLSAPVGLAIGSGLLADGLQLLTRALMGESSPSIARIALEAIIVDPMVDVGEGLSTGVRR